MEIDGSASEGLSAKLSIPFDLRAAGGELNLAETLR